MFAYTDVVAADVTNYNLRSRLTAAGWNGTFPVLANITINSGIYISANSTGVWAMDIDNGTPLPTNSVVNITNTSGFVIGMGGNGGNANSGAGGAGGPAIRTTSFVTITNNGTFAGGGGGGGAGAQGSTGGGFDAKSNPIPVLTWGGGGGGGGRTGRTNSSGGAGGFGDSGNGSAGGTGTASSAGGGGAGASGNGGTGGSGGGWGAAGGTSGGSGGAAGACTNGNANITWAVTGTRLGALN